MRIPEHVRTKVKDTYARYYAQLSGIDADRIVSDVLATDKPKEQIALLEQYAGPLVGKSLLEIGSGYGIFVTVARSERGIEAFGVEPNGEGFGDSYELSLSILSENGIDTSVITSGMGEQLPFPDNTFDVVFSTNVLEHVSSPREVLKEAIRVCKPGGVIQIVVPNYGSFFDGHYACVYFPYQPKWMWKWYIRHILKRDPSYVDTLRTEVNVFSLKRYLRSYINSGSITVVTWGEEIFRERMHTLSFSAWAGLGRIKRWVELAHRLRVVSLITWAMVMTRSFSPIILTMRKEPSERI